MAVKTAFFLLAFVVLVARTHSHARVPDHAPDHAHAPTKHHHVPPPMKAPIHTPAKPPVHPPIHGRVAMCEEYCKPESPKRPCMKVCTACCAKYKCVPVGSKKCTIWGRVMIREKMVQCP